MAQIKDVKYFLEEMFAPIFLAQHSRYLAVASVVLATLLIIYTSVQTLQHWHADWQPGQGAPVAVQPTMANAEGQLLAQLPHMHLFGPEGDDDFLPLTNLQLRLTGISRDLAGHGSKVIVAEGDQPGKVYILGDTLLTGIVLKEINDDGIVLERGGHLERLPLSRNTLEFKEAPQTLWNEN